MAHAAMAQGALALKQGVWAPSAPIRLPRGVPLPLRYMGQPLPPDVVLTLEDALTLALHNNPTYLETIVARKTSAANLRAAWGGLLPQLNANFQVAYTGPGTETFAGEQLGSTSPYDFSQYQINLTYTLSASTILSPKVERANHKAAEKDIDQAGAVLRQQVTQQYLLVLQDQVLARLQDTLIADDSAQLLLATVREAAGAATQLDVQRAQVTLTQQQVNSVTAHNTTDIALLQLFQQLGVPQPAGVELHDTFAIVAPPLTLDSALALARSQNPALLALLARERAADADVWRQRGLYAPVLQVATGVSGQAVQYTNQGYYVGIYEQEYQQEYQSCLALDSIGSAAGLPPRNCGPANLSPQQIASLKAQNNQFPFHLQNVPRTISATVSIPIFDGFQRERSVELATANRQNAQYNIRARELQLTADVTTAYLNVTTAAKTAALNEQNSAAARQSLALSEERYKVGAANYVDVTDARAAFVRAETDRINSVFIYHSQFAALESAVGQPLR
jgi:outer membrane protein